MLRSALACYTQNGRWAFNGTERKLAWSQESYGRPNKCDLSRDERTKFQANGGGPADVTNVTKWEWQTAGCEWENFNYETFCRTLGATFGSNASILIVGDELSWGFERRLFYNIRASKPKSVAVNLFPDGCSEWDKGKEKQMCSGNRYCHDVLGGESVAVRYIKSKDLSLENEVSNGGVPWIKGLYWRPTVVMLTHSLEASKTEEFESDVTAAIGFIRRRSPDSLIIYRNAPAVHACPSPSPSPSASDDSSIVSRPPPTDPEFSARNKIAKKIVEKFGGLYLDVNGTISKRPPQIQNSRTFLSQNGISGINGTSGTDLIGTGYSGGDLKYEGCVDVCEPGILDSWVHLFYNMLTKALPSPDMKKQSARSADIDESDIEQAVEGISVLQFLRKGPKSLPTLKSILPGSKIRTKKEFEKVNEKLDCFVHKGEWSFNPKPRVLPWIRKPWHSVSICDSRHEKTGGISGAVSDEIVEKGGNWSVRDSLKWEWKTKDTCPLEKFSREGFCRTMGSGRSILLIGDSMTRSFERHVFAHMLMGVDMTNVDMLPVDLYPTGLPEWDVGLRFGQCLGYSYCHDILEKPVEIRYCFNRGLTLTEIPLDGEAPWILKLNEWKPSILVLNRGAHYRSDEIFEPDVKNALYYVREKLPHALVIWRNTPPGHDNCEAYPAPISVRQDPSNLPYNWGKFSQQNEVARKYVEEIGGVYMDVDYATALRPDSHRGQVGKGMDCLHYCLPGPPDTWVVQMYNFLKELL